MVHSFANVRGATALLFATTLVVTACGGDDSGDTPSNNTKDTGTPDGNKDAGLDATVSDADAARSDANVGDASAADVAAALDEDGTDVSSMRADIVFPIACQHALECGVLMERTGESTVAGCNAIARGEYDEGVANSFSQDCLDARLDLYACIGTTTCACLSPSGTCNDPHDCGAEYDREDSVCAPFVGDSGM